MSKEDMYKKSIELIGVLEAIAIVAKRLAERLMRLEEEVERHEESIFCGPNSRQY